MADTKKLYDVHGNEFIPPDSSTSKQLFDLKGNPLDLTKLDPLGGLPQGPPAGNQNPTPDLAPFLGRLGAESLPFAGSFLGPEGVAAGAVAKNLLKSYFPETLGQGATDV